jgi:TetR/AcrR family fatty acid metabolism transcriptional regulator
MGEDRELAVVFQVDLRKSISSLQAVSRGRLRDYLEVLEGILRRGREAGVFAADLVPREAAKMVFGVLDELSTNWVLSRRNYRLESEVASATRFILRAVGAGDDALAP